MEIKSSLLKYKEFAPLKNNLIQVSEVDGKDKFRVKMIEYINDTSDNNDDMFFYEMLPFSRFLKPSDEAIAYTTPEHLIYLNSPGRVGENVRIWDFIYCHECLHQLWDTFQVGEKIKNAGLEYNHKLLNIASDCVINDYLKTLRKKEPFQDGIFPETLKDKFGIDYDRKNDTQYSLYVKLLKVYGENKKEMDKLVDPIGGQTGSDSPSGSGSSGSSSGSGGSGSSSGSGGSGSSSGSGSSGDSSGSDGSNGDNGESENLDSNTAQKDANEAQKHADNLKNSANSQGGKGASQSQIEKAQEAAKKAQEAANKAKECAENGDTEGEKKAAKEARKAAEEARKAAEEARKAAEGQGESEGGDGSGKNGSGDEDVEDINEIRKNAEEIIKKYKDKLTGYLGDFLNKCKSSTSLKREGLKVNTFRGISGWNTEMNRICKAFVKKKIFQKKRQYEKTYSRIRRGSGFVKFGQPIDPGRKIKEDKMDINVAFYIDRSGSMGNSINNVFKAVFYIADALKKYFGKEKIVNDTIFESYAFDTVLHKLQFGKKMNASGGTLSFNELLDYINKNTKEFLINVIITDAQFSGIDTSTVENLLKEIDGIIIFITNTPNETMKDISKKYSTKLNYILADSEFTLK